MRPAISTATLPMLDALAEVSRKALANVSKNIAPLEIEAWRGVMRELIASPTARFMVARAGDKIVGWHIALRAPVYFAPSKAMVTTLTLWVDPEHRRDGIGAELVDAVEAWARDQDAAFMSAGVYERVGESEAVGSARATADGSGEFYKSRGFTKSETHYMKELR